MILLPEDGQTTIFLQVTWHEVSNNGGTYSVTGGPTSALSNLEYDADNNKLILSPPQNLRWR